jgi:hypothetical protein
MTLRDIQEQVNQGPNGQYGGPNGELLSPNVLRDMLRVLIDRLE